jgi:hypothetical protein
MSKIEFIVTKDYEWLAVDNERIINDSFINHYALVDSAFEQGEYYLQIMVDGCGLDEMVVVDHEKDKIHWFIPEQDSNPVERWFTFDALQYRQAHLEGFKKIAIMRNYEFRTSYTRYIISEKEVENVIERLRASLPLRVPQHEPPPFSVWNNI